MIVFKSSIIFRSDSTPLKIFFCVYKKEKTVRSTVHRKSVKMKGFLAFSAQQKAKCVTWCHQTGSITQTQRNYRATYAESPTARNSILRWVQNFDEHGMVRNAESSGRPGASSNQEERVSYYFFRYSSRSLRRAEKDLNIPRSSIHYTF